MADSFEVTGMIISSMPVGEYDRRIVLLTRECGKISVFAKGARKPNSPLVGITRAFIFGKFEVYAGRDSYTVYRAHAEYYFEDVVNDLEKVCYACYFAELADYYGRENLDASAIVNLLYISLKALTKTSIPNKLVQHIYEIKIIEINGECPDFQDSGDYFGLKPDESTVYALQYIVSAPIEKLYTFTLSEVCLSELSVVASKLVERSVDKKIKSREMLDRI